MKAKLYHVLIMPKAMKQLKKMDKFASRLIYDWIKENLEGCEDPYQHGKGLTENHSGEWRYRVGNYRILSIIKEESIEIQIFKIGHRRDVY